MAERNKDFSRVPTPAVPDPEGGTTAERDFGKTDRYANKDEERDFNFRVVGDETSWDSGRETSLSEGTHLETDTRVADAEAPGVKTRPADPSIEPEKQ